MIECKHILVTTKHEKIFHEDHNKMQYGIPSTFTIKSANSGEFLSELRFQKGASKECGINGISNETLIIMAIERLKYFQKGDNSCPENEKTIECLETALMWMKRRTLDREARAVDGTGRK